MWSLVKSRLGAGRHTVQQRTFHGHTSWEMCRFTHTSPVAIPSAPNTTANVPGLSGSFRPTPPLSIALRPWDPGFAPEKRDGSPPPGGDGLSPLGHQVDLQ